MWTAVDPAQRVILVNLRDKKFALSKPKQGIVWTEHPGLTERLIARGERRPRRGRRR